jgi:hypothetical protein
MIEHHYAFYQEGEQAIPSYERTFGSKSAADKWVAKDPSRRFVTTGSVPDKFWY